MESLVWDKKPRLIDERISHGVGINDALLYLLPSSSGLGYQPLTLGTGVQIPLGAPKISWRIAQLIERTTDNREGVGLNPTVPTSLS